MQLNIPNDAKVYVQLGLQGDADNNDIMVQEISGLTQHPQIVASSRAVSRANQQNTIPIDFEPLEVVFANPKARLYWYRADITDEFDMQMLEELDKYEPVTHLRPGTLTEVEPRAWVNCRIHVRQSSIYLSVQISNLLYESGFIEL